MIQRKENDHVTIGQPGFLILGAPKCGTTTLYQILEKHPEITLSRPKEPMFYEAEFERGMGYYWQQYFAHCRGERAIGEARASKLFLPYVAARIRQTLPNVKLVAILRNPVERVFSHWWMRYCNGKERLGFQAALDQNLKAIRQGRTWDGASGMQNWLSHISTHEPTLPFYLEIGYYAQHLRIYLELFPAAQLKILFFDDLCLRPEVFFSEVYEFLDVSSNTPLPKKRHFNPAASRMALELHKLDRRFNVPKIVPASVRSRLKSFVSRMGAPREMDRELRTWLVEHYFDHNRQLEQLTGRDLSDWDKVPR